MRLFLITIILSTLFANLAIGQSMRSPMDTLLRHNLIEEDSKQDIERILKNEDDTSPSIIFHALMFAEMVKMVGRENINKDITSIIRDLSMSASAPTKQQQDSINQELSEYLTKIKSAGILTDSIYNELKANVEKGSYPTRIMLIIHMLQKTEESQNYTPDNISRSESKYLTRKQVEDAIAGWQKAGILNHLSKEQISSAKKKAVSITNATLNDVIITFPNVVHWFDTELENLKDPYAELVRKLSIISHGVFKPANVSDNFNKPSKNKVTLQFILNNKYYAKALQLQDDWIDPAFLDLVRQAVSDNKLAGQFYELYEGGQGGLIIFLTPKQHKYLMTNKLVVFAENSKSAEE